MISPASELSPEGVQAVLTGSYGRSLEIKTETGSTNDDVREAASSGLPSGHVIVADAQSKGRGAHGRVWSSPAGNDLYLSILERRTLSGAQLPWLTLAVGLGVRDAVAGQVPARVSCKWPNDVLIDERKCAGILVESSSMGSRVGPFVIGIGLDVNRTEFSPDLEATSMALARGAAFDRNAVLGAVLTSVEARVDQLHAGQIEALSHDLRTHLAWVGERVQIDDTEGTLLGLGSDGALLLSGDRAFRSGTLRRL